VICVLRFDLGKIDRFYNALKIEKKKGIVICFDFQKNYISDYLGEMAKIDAFDSKKIQEGFL